MIYPAVISIYAQNIPPGLESTPTDVSKTKKALDAIRCMILYVPPPGSPDYKLDDPEYKALRAQAYSTLEAFSQFLSTATAIKLSLQVNNVFHVLRDHGEKAGLLTPPLIRAMSGYLDAYKKERGKLWLYLEDKEEWIRTLYRNLKPDDSEQVCLLPFSSYEITLTSNLTLIQNPDAAASVVASASVSADDTHNPPVHSTSAAIDITTNCASTAIPFVQGASSARPEGSYSEVSPLTSIPAPSTNPIQEPTSVEHTENAPSSEDTPAPQADSGPARADPDEVSETPAPVAFSGTSDVNPQETESPSGSIPDAPRLTSLPAPSTARAQESAPAEPTLSAPMSEDAPALQEDPGPARADPDEVSETPAPVGSGVSSNSNPQETQSLLTEVSPILPSAVEHSSSSLADTSEKK